MITVLSVNMIDLIDRNITPIRTSTSDQSVCVSLASRAMVELGCWLVDLHIFMLVKYTDSDTSRNI